MSPHLHRYSISMSPWCHSEQNDIDVAAAPTDRMRGACSCDLHLQSSLHVNAHMYMAVIASHELGCNIVYDHMGERLYAAFSW